MNDFNERRLKFLPKEKFVELGLNSVAYIRQIEKDGEPAFVIHAADGTMLVELPQEDVARAAVKQYELVPLSLH